MSHELEFLYHIQTLANGNTINLYTSNLGSSGFNFQHLKNLTEGFYNNAGDTEKVKFNIIVDSAYSLEYLLLFASVMDTNFYIDMAKTGYTFKELIDLQDKLDNRAFNSKIHLYINTTQIIVPRANGSQYQKTISEKEIDRLMQLSGSIVFNLNVFENISNRSIYRIVNRYNVPFYVDMQFVINKLDYRFLTNIVDSKRNLRFLDKRYPPIDQVFKL